MPLDTSTLAQGSMYGQMAGALMSAAGSYYGAKSQRSALDFQADIAAINARFAELGAQQELIRGEQQIGAQTLRAGKLKSRQRAALAANGVDVGEGSAAELLASTDIVKEIDSNTLNANAVRIALGYRMQAVSMQNDALIRRATAEGINPLGSAASTLLTSGGSVAKSWYEWSKVAEPKPSDPLGDYGRTQGWWG